MDKENKIIKYLDNQLSEKEKKAFEEQLANSEELQRELQEYRSVLNEIKNLNRVHPDEKYFASLVPRVRERLEKKKYHNPLRQISYAFSFAFLFLVGYFVFSPVFNNSKNFDFSLDGTFLELTDDEKFQLMDYLDGENNLSDYYESAIDDNQLELADLVGDFDGSILSEMYGLDLDDLTYGLSDEDTEVVYNELININFN